MKVKTATGVLPVYVSNVDEDFISADGDEPIDAFYDRENNCLAVRYMANADAMKQNLHHELLHVAFSGHGDETRCRVLGCRTTKAADRREEDIVLFLEPAQFDLLTRNGFLRYPKPPRLA